MEVKVSLPLFSFCFFSNYIFEDSNAWLEEESEILRFWGGGDTEWAREVGEVGVICEVSVGVSILDFEVRPTGLCLHLTFVSSPGKFSMRKSSQDFFLLLSSATIKILIKNMMVEGSLWFLTLKLHSLGHLVEA